MRADARRSATSDLMRLEAAPAACEPSHGPYPLVQSSDPCDNVVTSLVSAVAQLQQGMASIFKDTIMTEEEMAQDEKDRSDVFDQVVRHC